MIKNDFTVVVATQNLAEEVKNLDFTNVIVQGDESLRGLFKNLQTQYLILYTEKQDSCVNNIIIMAETLNDNPSFIYCGENNNKHNVPIKIYEFLSGIPNKLINSKFIGMSSKNALAIANIKCSEDEFNNSILLEARAQNIAFKPIKTDNTKERKYNFSLLTKNLRLYYVFIKFSISALISYVVDIGSFLLFLNIFTNLSNELKILIATVFSRILCSLTTYILNKGAVFKSQAKQKGSIVKFVTLAIIQLLASWLLVWSLGSLFHANDLADTGIKIVVDLVIFMASFTLQRDWVFKDVSSKKS